MDFFDTLLLGMVEGLTEFIPVSSTAHLLAAGKLLRIADSEFWKSFVIVIQLGAIMAVIIAYGKRIMESRALVLKIGAAFIPTALIGFALYRFTKDFLFENLSLIALMLIVGGIVILVFEAYRKQKTDEATTTLEDIPYAKAVLIGIIQALAIVPGVSRSGATIVGGMMAGISRVAIVEFSFLLAVPTMVAAAGYDLVKTGMAFSQGELSLLLLGFMFSLIFALLAIRFFIRFIQRHTFSVFGIYRIIAGILILIFLS